MGDGDRPGRMSVVFSYTQEYIDASIIIQKAFRRSRGSAAGCGRAELRALKEGRAWPNADLGGTGTDSGCVGMRLDASGCVGMRRDASGF